jgi:ribosome biogenesis GTPase / thiamine phosphate phosphatase
MESEQSNGLVVRVTGKEVWVETRGAVVPCLLRGRFRRAGTGFQIVAGDRVELTDPAKRRGSPAIEAVLPRRSHLSRCAGGRAAEERVIVSNVDTLFVVESLRSPDLSRTFADRVLVSAETGRVPVRILLNKTDLASDDGGFAALYDALGYPVTRTSAVTGEGIGEVASLLRGGIYAFVGRSGVGKSSIVNRIAPDLNLRVREVAEKTGRGKHTTTSAQLFPIEGGYVADTPGMQTFGYPGADSGDLARCFPEFRALEGPCRFSPCTHSHEPGCAVKEAVEEGRIARSRHESYIEMFGEVETRRKSRYS